MSKKSAYIDDPSKGQLSVPRGILNKVNEGLDLQAQSKAIADRLKAIKEQLKEELGNDIKIVVPETGSLTISPKSTLVVDDNEEFYIVFGDRASDLLTETVSYKVSSKLKDIAADETHEEYEDVMAYCNWVISSMISFKVDSKA